MSKHLLTGSVNSGASNWQLPPDADVADLQGRIIRAMAQGEVLQISVLVCSDPVVFGELVLNGKRLEQAAVVEIPSSNETDSGD